MKRIIIKVIYKLFEKDFDNVIVEKFFGEIPNSLLQPSIDFLSQGKNKLEPFLSIEAYSLKNRAIFDPKNTQFYEGALMIIKALLVVVRKKHTKVEDTKPIDTEKEKTFMEKIEEFKKAGKDFVKSIDK